MLLDRHRIVGAALDGWIVGDDHTLPTRHPSDSGDDPRGGAVSAIESVGGQRGDLQQRATGVEKTVDPIARQQFAAFDVTVTRALRPAERRGGQFLAQLCDEAQVLLAVGGG